METIYPFKYKMELVNPVTVNGCVITEMRRIICISKGFYEQLWPSHARIDAARHHAESVWGIYGERPFKRAGWYPAPIEVLNAPLKWELSMLDMAEAMAIISDANVDTHNADMTDVADNLELVFDKLQSKTDIPTNEITVFCMIGDW